MKPHFNHSRFFDRKPAWWPENEPWPPRSGRWGTNRTLWFRRFGCFFFAFFLLVLFGFSATLVWLLNLFGVSQASGQVGWLVLIATFVILFLLAFLFSASRLFRRVSVPVSDLLSAADRVAQGDFSVRVTEQGPREIRTLAHAFNTMASRLQENADQRRKLLADVTHELRTPLTVIQGNLEGMLDGVYPADEIHLKSLIEETQLLTRLVEDLRILALAESGALSLQKEPTDLVILVNDVITAFRLQSEAAGINILVEAVADIPVLNLDAERMHQVVENLVSNALHYTPREGKIEIKLQTDSKENPKSVTLEISDNGPGISVEELPYIFNRFYKSRDSDGMGLGLAIAKNLVEAHGGTIVAESEPGKGTTIRITLAVEAYNV
jgi:signal transduction histidine kinase